jgi:hypothetical protein
MDTSELKRRTLFREVNMRIRAISERFGVEDPSYVVLCECGAESCLRRVEVPAEVFSDVREDGQRFVVAPGHERPGGERVLETATTYSLVGIDSPAPRSALRSLAPNPLTAGTQ